MRPANCIHFLQERIQGIGSALLFNLSCGVFKFPTTIVNILKVDELANIWFFANRPEQHLQEFEREFPAHLQLYRKGKGYYLQITGKARIVNDPEELNELIGLSEEIKTKAFKEMVLIKVKISNAEYYDYNWQAARRNTIKGWITRLYNWLFKEQYRPEPFILQPAPSLGF